MAPPLHGPDLGGDIMSQTLIWGTTVSMDDCKASFVHFVESYRDAQGVALYVQQLEQIRATGNYNYSLDCTHLAALNEGLYRNLVRYPQEGEAERV